MMDARLYPLKVPLPARFRVSTLRYAFQEKYGD